MHRLAVLLLSSAALTSFPSLISAAPITSVSASDVEQLPLSVRTVQRRYTDYGNWGTWAKGDGPDRDKRKKKKRKEKKKEKEEEEREQHKKKHHSHGSSDMRVAGAAGSNENGDGGYGFGDEDGGHGDHDGNGHKKRKHKNKKKHEHDNKYDPHHYARKHHHYEDEQGGEYNGYHGKGHGMNQDHEYVHGGQYGNGNELINGMQSTSVYRDSNNNLVPLNYDKWVTGYADGGPASGYAAASHPAKDGFPPSPNDGQSDHWGGYSPNFGPSIDTTPSVDIAVPQADFGNTPPPTTQLVIEGAYWHAQPEIQV